MLPMVILFCSIPKNVQISNAKENKRPTGLNGHSSIRDLTLTSCQKGSYLYQQPHQNLININGGKGKQDHNPQS